MSEQAVSDYSKVDEAWQLSDSARDYIKKANRPVSVDELWEKVFALSPLVDADRTRNEGGIPLQRVFLRTSYGLQRKEDTDDWIPFRHGPVNVNFFQSL